MVINTDLPLICLLLLIIVLMDNARNFIRIHDVTTISVAHYTMSEEIDAIRQLIICSNAPTYTSVIHFYPNVRVPS